MKKIYTYILILFISAGCAHRQYTKQGAKYEEAGMLQQATEYYNAALNAKNTHIDARIGLMRTGTLYANELEKKIEESYIAQNDNEVVENYLKLEKLNTITKKQDVSITISERTLGQYFEAKNRYIIDHYAKGKRLLENENFEGAIEHFQLVIKVSPDYGDSNELIRYCKAEPLYRNALLYMQFKKYRSAYSEFGKTLKIDPNFKDAQNLRQESLYSGMLTVTFLPIYIPNRTYQQYADALIVDVNSKVKKANNPFLQMRERTQASAIQELQKQALLANQIIDITQTIPIRAALSCRLNDLSYYRGRLKKTVKKGFVKETLKNDTTIFHKVYYTLYEQKAEARINFSYSLISVESGLNLFSGNLNTSDYDEISFIVFDGDKKNLYAGDWENKNTPYNPSKDNIKDDFISRSQTRLRINGRRILRSDSYMKNLLIERASDKMSKDLIYYNPEEG